MKSTPHTRPEFARPALQALAACTVAGLLAAASPARADCGCSDDGHGAPKKPAATAAQSGWLAQMLDWRMPKPRPASSGPAR